MTDLFDVFIWRQSCRGCRISFGIFRWLWRNFILQQLRQTIKVIESCVVLLFIKFNVWIIHIKVTRADDRFHMTANNFFHLPKCWSSFWILVPTAGHYIGNEYGRKIWLVHAISFENFLNKYVSNVHTCDWHWIGLKGWVKCKAGLIYPNLDMEPCQEKRFPKEERRMTRHQIGWKRCDQSEIQWPSIWLATAPNNLQIVFFYNFVEFSSVTSRQENHPSFFLIVFFIVQVFRHAKIGHFDNSIIGEQNVTGSKITMENLRVNIYNMNCWTRQ